MNIGSLGQKILRDLQVAFPRSDDEWGVAGVVLRIHISAVFNKIPNDVQVSIA